MSSTIDYAKARDLMVEQQIRPWEVLDPRVLDVLATLPREDFVPAAHRALAYTDIALPLPHGERMMKPVVEGRTLQSLALHPGDDVIHADAFAYQTERRFSAICVTAAVDSIPAKFVEWLQPGGRMFVIRGRSPAMEAVLLHHDAGQPRIESLFETDLPYLAGAAPQPVFEF